MVRKRLLQNLVRGMAGFTVLMDEKNILTFWEKSRNTLVQKWRQGVVCTDLSHDYSNFILPFDDASVKAMNSSRFTNSKLLLHFHLY